MLLCPPELWHEKRGQNGDQGLCQEGRRAVGSTVVRVVPQQGKAIIGAQVGQSAKEGREGSSREGSKQVPGVSLAGDRVIETVS